MTRPLSPHFLITAALALVDVEATGDNEGDGISASLARRYRVPNGLADDAAADVTESAASAAATRMAEGWSAAFVHHVGYWSHFDHRLGASVWPLPATQSCAELAAFAASNFVLAADAPQPGDV